MNRDVDIAKASFECQKCGNCCRTPGWVYVSAQEISEIARFLSIERQVFLQKYATRDNGWFVISTPDFRPDCFLDDEGNCLIYSVRPSYCRTYPHIFHSRSEYRTALKICPELQRITSLKIEIDGASS